MTIYFVRHGETIWNKKGILQGHKNSPLTYKGIKSAKKKGKVLNKKGIEVIYSSDLGRCFQTAEIINKFLGVKIVKTRQLRERDFGNLNGKPDEMIKKILDLSNPKEKAPNGESFNDLRKRVIAFINKIPSNKFNNVLLVIHDGTARAILSKFYNVAFNSKKCSTSENIIYSIEKNNKIKKIKL